MYKYMLGIICGMVLVAWGFIVQTIGMPIFNLIVTSLFFLGMVVVITYAAFKLKIFQDQ